MTIYEKIKNAPAPKEAMILMPIWSYSHLPAYADIYIRPAYEMIFSMETLIEFVQHFIVEYEESKNPAKRGCIQEIVFPIYKSITGINYNEEL